jgi:hypothetical protein
VAKKSDAAKAPVGNPAPPAADPQRPATEFRLGRMRMTVWANHHPERGVWYSVTATRLYKEGDAWKASTSYGRDDLHLIARLAEMVEVWIFRQQQGGVIQESPRANSDAQESAADSADIPF